MFIILSGFLTIVALTFTLSCQVEALPSFHLLRLCGTRLCSCGILMGKVNHEECIQFGLWPSFNSSSHNFKLEGSRSPLLAPLLAFLSKGDKRHLLDPIALQYAIYFSQHFFGMWIAPIDIFMYRVLLLCYIDNFLWNLERVGSEVGQKTRFNWLFYKDFKKNHFLPCQQNLILLQRLNNILKISPVKNNYAPVPPCPSICVSFPNNSSRLVRTNVALISIDYISENRIMPRTFLPWK